MSPLPWPGPDSEDEGCLTLHILSLINCYSLLQAEAKVLHGSPAPTSPAPLPTGLPIVPPQTDNVAEDVSVIFTQRCAKFLTLQVGHLIKLRPPWWEICHVILHWVSFLIRPLQAVSLPSLHFSSSNSLYSFLSSDWPCPPHYHHTHFPYTLSTKGCGWNLQLPVTWSSAGMLRPIPFQISG